MVFSLALRFLRNREVAEELAQDVFLQCYRQLGQLEDAAHACSGCAARSAIVRSTNSASGGTGPL